MTFDTSYASSGEQSRAVESGLPADVAAFSLPPDVDRLVEPGLVAADWSGDEYAGMVTDSIVVFAVRPENPDEIAGWDDLTAEGIEVITPNPLTSGGAKWNIVAGYGAQLEQGKTEEAAVEYLRQLFSHVPVQDKSACESLATFLGDKGTVLLAYENEVITAQQAGEEIDYVVPEQTILIENPVAVVTESAHPKQAAAFVAFARRRHSASSAKRATARSSPTSWPSSSTRPRPGSSPSPTTAAGPRSRPRSSTPTPASWRGCSSSERGGLPGRRRGCDTGSLRPSRRELVGRHAAVDRAGDALPERDRAHPPGRRGAASTAEGWQGFREAATSPQALAALRLSLVGSLGVAVINAVVGTVIAWCWRATTFAASTRSMPSSTSPSPCPRSWPGSP